MMTVRFHPDAESEFRDSFRRSVMLMHPMIELLKALGLFGMVKRLRSSNTPRSGETCALRIGLVFSSIVNE